MKKIVLFLIIISMFPVYSLKLTLKENVYNPDYKITLKDIVKEQLDTELGDIIVSVKEINNYRLKNSIILGKLIDNGYFDINLSGDESVIYIVSKDDGKKTDENDSENISKENPLKYLENYLTNFIDKNQFNLKVNLEKIEPFYDLDNNVSDYKWVFDKLTYGLKDLSNLKKFVLQIQGMKYNVLVDITINSDIWISKHSFQKDDYMKSDNFYKKNVDITAYKDAELLVFDINKANNTRFLNQIGAGEALRWSVLKKIPMVIKDEYLIVKKKNDNFEIISKCTALQDGYENEKIKVKLINGKEKIGFLRKDNGEIYVEI